MYVVKERGNGNETTKVKWRMIQKGRSRRGKAGQEKKGASRTKKGWSKYRKTGEQEQGKRETHIPR